MDPSHLNVYNLQCLKDNLDLLMTAAPRRAFSIKNPAEDYPRVSWSSFLSSQQWSNALGHGSNWQFSIAAVTVFLYAWLVPLGVWGFLKWRQSVERRISGYTFLETMCVYGYSLFIYIPTSILWMIPVYWLEWLLIIIALVISGSVLVMTFWPAVRDDTKLTAFSTMAVIVSLHALLAVGFKLYFFQTPTYTGSSHSGQQTTPAANHTTLTLGKHQ